MIMRTMRYVAHTGEHYTILEEPTHFVVQLVGKRLRQIKREFIVSRDDKGFTCNGRRCKADRSSCEHVRMLCLLTEQPVPSNVPKPVIYLPVTTPLERAIGHLKIAFEQLAFNLTVWQRTLEGQVEKLIELAIEEERPRVLHELMHVLENNMQKIAKQHMQCGRCILHKSCVTSERQGMKCLSYFLCLDYADELDWYECIPLTQEVLYTVDFQTLLILSALHRLNFDTLEVLTYPHFRARLLSLALTTH